MAVTKGYSLWVMPPAEAYESFSKRVVKLAHEYSVPVFQPHITILGEILEREHVVVEKAGRLAAAQRPFPISLDGVGYGDSYFRALFIKVDKTSQLLQLHDGAKELFNMHATSAYVPHLSLLYGDFPKMLKDEIAREIGSRFPIAFEVSSLVLFKTDGEVVAWHRVREFPFGKSAVLR